MVYYGSVSQDTRRTNCQLSRALPIILALDRPLLAPPQQERPEGPGPGGTGRKPAPDLAAATLGLRWGEGRPLAVPTRTPPQAASAAAPHLQPAPPGGTQRGWAVCARTASSRSQQRDHPTPTLTATITTTGGSTRGRTQLQEPPES